MRCIYSTLALLYASTAVAATTVDGLEPLSRHRKRSVESACLAAQKALGNDVVDLEPLNQTVVDNNWSVACVREPFCIVSPVTAEQVSKAVKIISSHGVKFATRSGGHSPNPGWASISKSGILINMSGLNKVTVSSDNKIARIGPGQRWGAVNSILETKGLAVVGGREPDVGVAGLILGGGYHHFSGKYGLAADNVANFEVVTADGCIKNANAKENSDLFWALKGGGSNFGIVTRYDLETIPVSKIWVMGIVYSPSQALEAIDAFTAWQKNGASDQLSTVTFLVGLDSVIVGLIYLEPAVKPEAFKPFYGLKPLQVLVPPTNVSYTFLDQIANGGVFSTTRERHDYRGVSSKIDADTTKAVYQYWLPKAQAAKASAGVNQTFAIQHVPKNLVDAGRKNGGNPLGLTAEDQLWWTTLVDWEHATDDETARSASIETTDYWKKLGKERGQHLPFIFMNDASRDQSPISTYGANNINRLKQIAKKYDSKEFFQKQQNDGFLLRKV